MKSGQISFGSMTIFPVLAGNFRLRPPGAPAALPACRIRRAAHYLNLDICCVPADGRGTKINPPTKGFPRAGDAVTKGDKEGSSCPQGVKAFAPGRAAKVDLYAAEAIFFAFYTFLPRFRGKLLSGF